MITFIQRVLQRHYQWLFILLLIIIIISFVFTIGAAPGISSGSSHKKRDFYGFNLSNANDTSELFQGAALSMYLNTGAFPDNKQSMEDALLARAVLIHTADTLQIPEPTEEALVEFIQSRPAFQGITGSFDQSRYEEFVRMVSNGLKSENARIFIAQDLRIEKALSALTDPGYTTPFEIKQQAELVNTQWSILIAELDFENFSPYINVTEEDLRNFYEENANDYTVPNQIVATYVSYNADDFESELTPPTEEDLLNFWTANPNFFTNESFEEARETVADAYKHELAKRKATEQATELAYQLYNQNITYGSEAFKMLLESHNLSLKTLPPFTEEELNTFSIQQGLPYNLLAQAFGLNDTHYYSEAIPTGNGSALLFYEKTIPAHIPAFEEVHEAVVADYRIEQKRHLFAEKAIKIEDTLRTALQDNNTFEQAASKEGLKTQAYESFTILKAPQELSPDFLGEIKHAQAGEMTRMVPTPQGVAYVFIESKLIPEIKEDSPEWEAALGQLSFLTAHANLQNFVAEMIDAGLQKIN